LEEFTGASQWERSDPKPVTYSNEALCLRGFCVFSRQPASSTGAIFIFEQMPDSELALVIVGDAGRGGTAVDDGLSTLCRWSFGQAAFTSFDLKAWASKAT
jgi:hypothetical protein